MGKHLTEMDIARIVEAIDTLDDVTWANVIAVVKRRLGREYTRQALSSHARVKIAFDARKRAAREVVAAGGVIPRTDVERLLLDKVEALQRQVARLEAENAAAMRQFAVWAYNAHALDIPERELDRPLPPSGRKSTETRSTETRSTETRP
jgi:hypothetical protein